MPLSERNFRWGVVARMESVVIDVKFLQRMVGGTPNILNKAHNFNLKLFLASNHPIFTSGGFLFVVQWAKHAVCDENNRTPPAPLRGPSPPRGANWAVTSECRFPAWGGVRRSRGEG